MTTIFGIPNNTYDNCFQKYEIDICDNAFNDFRRDIQNPGKIP